MHALLFAFLGLPEVDVSEAVIGFPIEGQVQSEAMLTSRLIHLAQVDALQRINPRSKDQCVEVRVVNLLGRTVLLLHTLLNH